MCCGESVRIARTRLSRGQESSEKLVLDLKNAYGSENLPGCSYRPADFLAESARQHRAAARFVDPPNPPASSDQTVVSRGRDAPAPRWASRLRKTAWRLQEYAPVQRPRPEARPRTAHTDRDRTGSSNNRRCHPVICRSAKPEMRSPDRWN